MKNRVLIMAGGTGGHVFPALAVARALQKQDICVEWLGTQQGLESTLVPKAGIVLHTISVIGVRRTNWLTRLGAPFRLLLALYQSLRILHQFKPQVVLGMGGFAAGPGGIAAWLLRCPLVIHEQNAFAGVTNRILSRITTRTLEGFPKSFPNTHLKTVWVGNPVREDLLSLPPPSTRLSGREGRVRLLILGGSQGARILNQLCPVSLGRIPLDARPEIWHQTGKDKLSSTVSAYAEHQVEARVEEFIENMAEAYGWADLVICRSGALTVSELAAVGIASVLIPFPFAVDDHQTHNSRFLETVGAAKVIPQTVLDPAKLSDIIMSLARDRALLIKMAEMARTVAQPQASAKVVAHCKEVWSEPKKS